MQSIDAKGNTTIANFDDLGRTVEVDPPTGPSVTYTYNFLDQLTNANYGGALTTITYDYAGRKLTVSDPDMGSWTYTYDALNLTRQKDAKSQRICFYYDLLNRLTGKHYRSDDSCPSSPTMNVVYSYDSGSKGRRTYMSDPSGSTTWTYDNRGRMLTESKVITGSGTFLTQWTYNSADQILTMTYPGNASNGAGEQIAYAYLPQNVINTVNGSTTYVNATIYDPSGRVTYQYLGASSLKATYQYYPWTSQGGRLQYLQSGTPNSPTSLQNFSYTYDNVGNITSILDYNAIGTQTQSFGYDYNNRLLSASASGGSDGAYTESYTYDDVTGNLKTKTGLGTYTYDPNHKHAVSSTGNGWSFEYDANGNMFRKQSNDQDLILSSNFENQLVSAHNNNIFADGFENGNMSAWDSNVTDNGDLSVASTTQLGGSYALKTTIDDNNAIYVQDDSPNNDRQYNSRFYIRLNHLPMVTGDYFVLNQGYNSSGTKIFSVELYYEMDGSISSSTNMGASSNTQSLKPTPAPLGGHYIRANVLRDDGSWYSTNWYGIEDNGLQSIGHSIEIQWTAAVADTNHNGKLSLLIDGTLKQTLSNLDNDNTAQKIDYVRLGALEGIDSGTRGTYYLDSFISKRYSTIGTGHTIPANSSIDAQYIYDGDSNRVQSIENGVTTTYIGNYFEWTGSTSTMKKYYYAGTIRIAMRTGTGSGETGLKWLLVDHLGSTSVVVNADGSFNSMQLYKAWGEVRFASGTLPTDFTYTGQRSDSYINLLWYGSRWYDPALGRFTSPDSIVPGVGEGGNPNAVGYLGAATYSPLTVDYHESRFLNQLNLENRIRLQDPNFGLPSVPLNSIAFDRYAYSLNNPVRFIDPSGHFPQIIALLLTPPGLALVFATIGVGLYFAVPGVRETVTDAIFEAGQAVGDSISIAFHKKDWIPDNLLPEYRGLWGRAAEKYKAAYPGLPRGFQLPKELARELADLLNEGKSIEEAVDEMPELDDFIEDEGTN